MNETIFLAYLAIGALGELLSLKDPTLAKRWATGIQLVAGGFVAAWIIPVDANYFVIIGLLIARGGSIFGRVLSSSIDGARISNDDKKGGRVWQDPLSRKAGK